MQLKNNYLRYGVIAQFFHWLVVGLVVAQYTLGWMADDLPVSMRRLVLLYWHKSIGMTVLAVMTLRLIWRWWSPPPPLPNNMGRYERWLARITHWLLYGVLFALPVVGWLSSSASNLTVSYFGLFALPDILSPDQSMAANLKIAHQSLGWLLLVMLVLHILAAVRHHFLLRDNVLLRMLPFINNRALK